MIRDLSETLKAILSQPSLPPELAAAQIVFDRPADPFAPTQTTIDLFLYDIRENLDLRLQEPVLERSNGQVTIRQPPLRIACSYLVTAWPVGGNELALQEHQLISQVLQVLAGYPMIPPSFLQGALVGQQPPLPMVALHPDALKNISEFWTSLGNKLRASITVTVTVGMDVFAPVTGPMVITGKTTIGEINAAATQPDSYIIGGIVTDSARAPLAGASVTLVELGLVSAAGSDGRFTLGCMKAGNYTLRAKSGTKTRDVAITVPAAAGKNYDVQLT